MLMTQPSASFKKRRDDLMRAHPGSMFIIPGARLAIRNHDVHFPFRQESNFWYLTGYEESDAILVLIPGAGSSYKSVLFVLPRNEEREIWDGERYGVDRAKSLFGFDETYSIDEFSSRLASLFSKETERLSYRLNLNEAMDRTVLKAADDFRLTYRRSGKSVIPLFDPTEAIGEMRLFKTGEELELMRRAGKATADAHIQVMKEVRPGWNEKDVDILLEYAFRKAGCDRLAYGSIVAGGKNACCLHYHSNNETLKDGDVLLIDAAGEYQGYASDITRTFPIGKKFNRSQSQIYDIVLKSQLEALKLCRPGSTLVAIHNRATEVLIDGLLSLGLLTGSVKTQMESLDYKRFYPHGTGHFIGMDVHDSGLYIMGGEPRKLEAGMCFTVEPGIYVQPFDTKAPENFKGIGVRIEDDIVITSSGYDLINAPVPKTREEIEALRA